MTRPRVQRPGSAFDALAQAVSAAGKYEAVADDLGVTKSMLSRWLDPDPENGRKMPFAAAWLLARLHKGAARILAERFASMAGLVLQPASGPCPSVALAAAAAARESAEASLVVAEALEDGVVTPDEKEAMHRKAQEALETAARLVAAVDDLDDGTAP